MQKQINLKEKSPAQLDALYAKGKVDIPQGPTRGKVLLFIGGRRDALRSGIAGFFWKGKVFAGSHLKNNFLGIKIIPASVRKSKSLFDKKPTVVIDYSKSRWPGVNKVVDEIRLVAPGLYLGRADKKGRFA